jgi:hypothetical protein
MAEAFVIFFFHTSRKQVGEVEVVQPALIITRSRQMPARKETYNALETIPITLVYHLKNDITEHAKKIRSCACF